MFKGQRKEELAVTLAGNRSSLLAIPHPFPTSQKGFQMVVTEVRVDYRVSNLLRLLRQKICFIENFIANVQYKD